MAQTAISILERTWRAAQRHRTALSVLGHIGLFALALFLAFGLCYNFHPDRFSLWFGRFFLPLLPVVLLVKTTVFSRMKLYRGRWRYVGMRDVMLVAMASLISTCLFILVFFTIELLNHYFTGQRYFDRDSGAFPESVFPLDLGMTLATVCGARILVRLYYEELRPVAAAGVRRCIILGAGDTGEVLLREILRMPEDRYRVVGFLDDDPNTHGARIHDVPVLGRIDEVRKFCDQHEIQELLIALPRTPQKRLRWIVEQCQGANIRFQRIPAMEEVIAGKVKVSQVRDVDIKDLLGREQVELDQPAIREFLCGKRVLITGAGGSIGSEICRQVAGYRPACLLLVEQAENNLFEIDREIGRLAPDVARVTYVADICDARRVDQILRTERPEVIFHAAAHKHVPMMETNVGEAVKNNIHGTRVVADAAKRCGADRFVMISTDKAVNPTSVMGCTKRVAEKYIQQLRQGGRTHFMTVRFGNVLGSSGSVIPIFAKQIAEGGPVTVTDMRMTRYFMTIPEATQLVLQAGVMGSDGDIFVLDMGEPVKIVDLAREMITLSGLRPGEDIEIRETGVRPGEKLFEELSVRGEDMRPTTHEKIYIWKNRAEDWQRLSRRIDELLAAADESDPDELKRRLAEIVSEYTPKLSDEAGAPVDSQEADTPVGSASHEAETGAAIATEEAEPRSELPLEA